MFVATGASKFDDPVHFPWTIGWQPSYLSEGHAYATYILAQSPSGKVGVLYQNDDFGKDYLRGVTEGLGGNADRMLVYAASYETNDPTVDSQVVAMKAKGVDVFVIRPSPNSQRRRSARRPRSTGSRCTFCAALAIQWPRP